MNYVNIIKQELRIARTYEHTLLDEMYVADRLWLLSYGMFDDQKHDWFSTLLPEFHRPYKSRFIDNSSSRITTELSILLTSGFTTIKTH